MAWAMVGAAAISVVGGVVNANSAKKGQQAQVEAAAAANERGSAPGYAVPYIGNALERASTLANKPYEAYTGPLVAGENQYEKTAAQGLTDWQKGTPQSTQASAAFAGMAANPGAAAAPARSAFESMVSNPGQFGAGAVSTSNAYADNHLGTLNQAKAQDMGTTQANNGYIGAQSQGIAGAPQISGLLGNNPYLGQSSGQISGAPSVSTGKNALLGMNNPYLQDQIDYASGDITRNYDRVMRPQQQQRMAASGSFGNTGLMAQESEDQRNLAGELGRTASGMRMQDYQLQASLGESDLARRLGADQFNASNALTTQQTNAGLRSQDLARNLSGFQQQQGLGMDAAKFDANNMLGTQQFNAGLGQADLARNSQLMQQQGQYNASNQQGANQWNAGNQTQNNQFNTGAANSMSLANAGIQNNTNQFNVNNLNSASNFNATAANNANQFNSAQAASMYGQGASGLLGAANLTANQQQQGLQGLLNMDQRGLQGVQAMGLLGDRQRGIDQQGATSAYDQWQRAQNYGQQQQNNYQDSIRQLSYGSAPQVPQQQVSPGLQGLGAAASIYGLLKPTMNTGSTPQGGPSMYTADNFNHFGTYTG